jgi:capsular exopolysaccharide synthesis family protein
LYLYLLQKREENELSRTFTAYNTRVITPPYGNNIPVEPRKAILLLAALVVALVLPLAVYVIMRYMNTTIRGKKDLELLSAPFLGEIPELPAKKRKDKETYKIVVRDKSGGDIINEAFRVVRTNIEFILGKEDHKVLMTTSFNPGSGKTFTTANLAVSLAIKGKRVMLIDLDMRRASLSEYVSSPKTGISNYLSGFEDNLNSVICRGELHKNLDVIPVGVIPPNPTELLFNERFQEMINDLRASYDYILIDCPPIEIVADAAIINRFVDMTLFIVRVGILERSMVRELERIYLEQKYKHIGVLLNGVDDKGRYGYKSGYYTGKYYYKS